MEYLESAKHILIEGAQEGLKERNMASLLPEKVPYIDVLGIERTVVIVGVRLKDHYCIGYDQKGLLILPAKHLLSYLYLQEAHEVSQGGVNSMVMRLHGLDPAGGAACSKDQKQVLHVCSPLEEDGGAEDGASAGHTNWPGAYLRHCSGGPVWAARIHQHGEEADYRQRMGCHLRVYSLIRHPPGADRVLQHRFVPEGTEKVHEPARDF